MEKRISFFQFQSIKNVAKAIDPKHREMAALQKKAIALKAEIDDKKARLQREIDKKTNALKAEVNACQQQIDLLEAGIVQTLGFHVSDVVKKVIEPTGKTDPKTGKALTVTKYLPTGIVTYDEQAKEYVITSPEEGEQIVGISVAAGEGPTDVTSSTENNIPTSESFQGNSKENAEERTGEETEVSGVAEGPANGEEQASELPWE
jgi:phage host-nuclease inhibitor protein Gam